MNENIENKSVQEPKPKSFWKSSLLFVAGIAEIIIISLAIIIPIRYFLVQPFYVRGASMIPNFHDGEYLIIDELSYRIGEPERGEVIVFKYPLDKSQYFIKRIVGLPGESVTLGDGKIMVINEEYPGGIFLDESFYLVDGSKTYGETTIKLGEEEYLVLGDNRGSSLDSRSFGALDEDLIIGKVWFRGWPIDNAGLFEKPTYAGLE